MSITQSATKIQEFIEGDYVPNHVKLSNYQFTITDFDCNEEDPLSGTVEIDIYEIVDYVNYQLNICSCEYIDSLRNFLEEFNLNVIQLNKLKFDDKDCLHGDIQIIDQFLDKNLVEEFCRYMEED